ncbi:lipoprotein, partial [human gut metagenome]
MKTRFFAFAALALTLAACNNDNENLNDGPVAARFTAEITPATRVNSEGTDWTDGDRIGVTGAGFTNVPYKRENGKFVTDGTTIYFNDTETKT